ncbi:MAG: hypothetical protein JWM56_1149 [Candidatus Peribacteria bacterium]|nr:hypothetical protein [Candidatus Peribacteria bacterium]
MFLRYASAQILFDEAKKRGLNPVWETADGLFSFRHRNKDMFVYYTKLHINSQLGAGICRDKSLARAFLARGNFPNIPFCYSRNSADIQNFFSAHQPVIQKPLAGMKSDNVRLIGTIEDLDLKHLHDTICEKYIEGTEFRCLVLNGKTIGMQKKLLEPTEQYPWRKQILNLDEKDWHGELLPAAEAIAGMLHMGFMAVDFIVDAAGTAWVLELNSMPGLHSWHEPRGGQRVDIGQQLMAAILEASVCGKAD